MNLKNQVIEKLVDLTNRELDFLLHIARFQDKSGMVWGVYYKDTCKAIKCCKQTFYAVLRSLKTKGIISYVKASDTDYDIQILNNDFTHPESYKEGYVNLNRETFRNKEFKNMKAKEKFLLLHFMKITFSNRGVYVIGMKTFYDTYKKLLKITEATSKSCEKRLRGYLHSLRSFFGIKLLRGKYYIAFCASKFQKLDVLERGANMKTAPVQQRTHLAKMLCRRAGIKKASQEDFVDVGKMITQFSERAKDAGYDIMNLMQQCIKHSAEEQEHKPLLKPKRINMLITACLGQGNS